LHPELHGVPIYYASPLAKRCMKAYQTYINSMNDKIRQQYDTKNPFIFKHILNLKGLAEFDDNGEAAAAGGTRVGGGGLNTEGKMGVRAGPSHGVRWHAYRTNEAPRTHPEATLSLPHGSRCM
jgi:hypothetical protein